MHTGQNCRIGPQIVGNSQAITRVREAVERLGRGRWTVLLLGESGTGKEVVARAIHAVENRGAFVPIDCTALVGPLAESELFGHVRGAFTGATSAKRGLLECADGGTAFLDEVGELPLDSQAKLLRVLETQEVRPVGSTRVRKLRFRIIAATNRDLAREVRNREFREDLFYRLNIVCLVLPPLRDRREDIPILARYLLRRNGAESEISAAAMKALMEYDWPGNVRELDNCLQQAMALKRGPVIDRGDLPAYVRCDVYEQDCVRSVVGKSTESLDMRNRSIAATEGRSVWGSCGIRSLDEVKRDCVLDALRRTGGDRGQAARLLGVGRTTLYRWLKEYGICKEAMPA